jgi:O-antigen ligase/tetratricopeptide (TPR) repeat protein
MKNIISSSSLFQKLTLIGLGIIVFLPLLSAPPWFSPPSWGKTVLFRIIVIFLAVIALWIFARLPKEKKILFINTRSPLFLPLTFLGLFLSTLLIATLFSLDFYASFWGTPTRSWGIMNFLFAAIFGLLTFLSLQERQWRLVWTSILAVGTLVALVAFAQQWGIKLTETFATYGARPVATLGSPLVLGAYLAILSPIALSAAFFAKRHKHLIFTILFSGIFVTLLAALFLTLSRGAWIGLTIALTFFVLLYPIAFSRIRLFSFIALAAILLSIGAAMLLPFSSPFQDQQFSPNLLNRLSFDAMQEDPRIQAWPGLMQAVFDRPLLGYGPYNSSIAFDQYYTADIASATGWWDSAHNILLDIALWTGIPGLFLFLAFFSTLFWRLQQVKRKIPSYALFAHGTQAALLTYIGALFFSFDVFPLLLLFFLLIGFSFFLLSKLPPPELQKKRLITLPIPDFFTSSFFRGAFAVLAVWFLYTFTLQPFFLNKEVILARHEAENNQCVKAIERIDPLANSNFFFTEYIRSQYIDVIGICIRRTSPKTTTLLSQKAVQLLEKSAEIRPFFTRNWILLGGYTNNLIASAEDEETRKTLTLNADHAFQKAIALSPNREETYREWIRTYKLLHDPKQALEKIEECLIINPKAGSCWWEKAAAHVQLNDDPEVTSQALIAARELSYVTQEERLLSFIDLYDRLFKQEEKNEYYEQIAWAYERLILGSPENVAYHTSLAFVYRELGEYENANRSALNAQRIDPAITENVTAFLDTLPSEYQKNSPQQIIYVLILEKKYALAKEKALQCKNSFPENTHCEAWGVVAELWLGERDTLHLGSSEPPPFNEHIAKHFYTDIFLDELLQFYIEKENYEQLVEVYARLNRIEETPQHHSSLAFAYDKVGDWDQAARHSFRLYELQPAAKEEVRAFLKNVFAKGKASDPVRYNELQRHHPYKDIEEAFPGIFESL